MCVDRVLSLVLGAGVIVQVVLLGFLRGWWTISQRIQLLILGTVFVILGLLGYLGISTDLFYLCQNAIWALFLIPASIAGLYSPPSPGFPRWMEWGGLIIGIFCLWQATGWALAFWSPS